jgi:DNA primase catalytic subunit
MKTWGDVFNQHKRRGCDPSYAAYRADQWEKARNTPKITGSLMAYLETARPDPNQYDLNAVDETDVRAIYNAVKPYVRDSVNFQDVWDAISSTVSDKLTAAESRIAELEWDGAVAAWRWKFLVDTEAADKSKWNVQKNKPDWYRTDMADVVLEPLYTRADPALSNEVERLREALADLSDAVRNSIEAGPYPSITEALSQADAARALRAAEKQP